MIIPYKKLVAGLTLMLALAGCRPGGPDGTSAAMALAPNESTVQTTMDRPQIIESPSRADLMQVGPLEERSLGRVDAPVTMIEYASLTCPYCRAFHEKSWPAFKKKYVDTGRVRYILREFPIGRSSGNAWLITRCAPKDKFFKLYALFLKNQAFWVAQDVRLDAMYRVARQVGMDRATFDACLANQKIIDGIKWSKRRGRQLGVSGTPTFFINDRKVPSIVTMAELEKIITPLIAPRFAGNTDQ